MKANILSLFLDCNSVYKIVQDNEITKTDIFREQYDVFIFEKNDNSLITYIRNLFHRAHGLCFVGHGSLLYRIINFFYIPVFSDQTSLITSILDVWCSTWSFLSTLPKHINKSGIEISKDASKIAQKKGINIIAETIEWLHNIYIFDTVRSCHVIEHIDNYELHFEKLISHTKNWWNIIIYTPNYQSCSSMIFGRHREGYYEDTHCSIFSLDSMIKFWLSKWLKVIDAKSYPMWYTIASFMRLLKIKYKLVFYVFFFFYYPIASILSKIFVKKWGALAICFQKI